MGLVWELYVATHRLLVLLKWETPSGKTTVFWKEDLFGQKRLSHFDSSFSFHLRNGRCGRPILTNGKLPETLIFEKKDRRLYQNQLFTILIRGNQFEVHGPNAFGCERNH